MNRVAIAIAALGLMSSGALAQQAGGRQTSPYTKLSKEQCTAAVAGTWREAEEWTRKSDGKVRNVKARCVSDAKEARKQFAAKLPQ